MNHDRAKELVAKYFNLENGVIRTTVTTEELENFVHHVDAMTHRDNPALMEVRDLLRFMFIDRQHTEVAAMRVKIREALHKNRHGILENKNAREAEEDLATLQNYVGLVGTELMTFLTPMLGRELHYINNIRTAIQRNLDKQNAPAAPESKLIIEP